jgi:hypothetical protein
VRFNSEIGMSEDLHSGVTGVAQAGNGFGAFST